MMKEGLIKQPAALFGLSSRRGSDMFDRQENPEEMLNQLQLVFLTVEQVATLFHVKPGTVYKWIEADKIPYRKASGKVLFLAAEMESWVIPQSDKPNRLRKAAKTQQAEL
jgi:excisionase family DNA binding protein